MEVPSFMAAVGGYFVEPIGKHCGYLIHYNSNIKDLEIKIKKLREKRDGVQLIIDAEIRNGQLILPEVKSWIEKVRILEEDVEANKWRDGWWPRYSWSRNAKKKTLEIDGLLSDAAPFVTRVCYPPPLGIGSSSIEGIMDFESITKMRKEVLEALRTDKVNMIAICGMAGIGKTTMAKEVAKRAKDDKLFEEVGMAVVSQTLDLKKIQGQIAEMLGLKFDEEYTLARAERLKARLMGSESVLIILDDVWDALDLEAVGIPYGGQHNRCKILLTSRSEEACTQMKTQKIFPIKVLPEEEAWNLFREMAGNCIDTPKLHPIAKEVAKECGGLPLAIVIVGKALANKREFEWSDALQQLKKAISKNITGRDSKVYSSIELSYSYLKSDEDKSCFLLCCLFPEDQDILIEFLVSYGVAQRLFARIDTVAEARNRVHTIVMKLKRSFLLLDSEKGEEFVKMHDVVRDVAISIAAEYHGFLVRCNEKMEEWPERDSCERSTAISLVSKELKRHLDGLECPKLEANKRSFDGWWPRYSTSRNAKKTTLKIDGLLEDGRFLRVSYPPPPSGMKSFPVKDIKDFYSRTKKMNEVLEALEDDKVNMIAICGTGGIGKTSMAKVVANKAKFDEVALAVVSRDKDESKIQDEIAGTLKLHLNEKDPLHERAEKLKTRLTGNKSVLVILDDVREKLNLEEIGIPYGGQHKRCKILLTSRSEEACNQMKSEKIVKIEVLSKKEAWNLFREMAGNCVDNTDLRQTAEEVAKECGGLPVAIVTVGRALENKSEFEWSAALQQLKNAIPKNIPGLDPKAYSGIEFSYNYLKNDEAKSCFSLCCLLPEDYNIAIEDLVRYGVGLGFFEKIDTMSEARNRVHAIVKNLKRSFLLLDSERGEHFVKMHNVVRDVAISIAAEYQGSLVRCNEKMEEWPERDSCERSTAISLVSKELKRHPDDLECPKLELLQLAFDSDTLQTLPPNLFKGMKGLKVLTLVKMFFPSLPQSINVLQNLRTLQFVDCDITDVSAIGELRKLEILSFRGSEIEELPGEMRNLSCLKLLELTGCRYLERIPPDLLSSLSHLEELYMFGVDVKWKPMEEEEEKKGANASLTELMSLSYLMALKIQIPNIKFLPKDLAFKNETIKFQIFASGNGGDDLNYLFENSLILESCDLSDIAERQVLLQLLKRSEILMLKKIKDLKSIAYELDKEGFQYLKVLEVVRSDDVEYVMDATSYLTPRAAFPILESLELRGLTNLKEIYHSQFPDRSSSSACFGSLKSLRLRTVPRLIGFCTGVGPVELVQPSLNQEVGRIGTDEVTNLEKNKTTDIQQHTGPFPESTPIISHKLFSSNTILWAPDLEILELELADSLGVVFDLEGLKVNEDHQRIAVLAKLKTLQVHDLSELTYVWKNVPLGIQGFQKLTSIEVSNCHRLRYLFPTSIAKLLVELQSITIYECDAIENIVQRDGEEEATDIKAYSFEWSSIKKISLRRCPKLKTIGSEIQSPRKSKKINRELDSRPNEQELGSPSFLCRCLECVPRRKNYSLMAVSDQGTTNKSQRSYSVKEEGTLTKPKDPKVGDIDNPSEIRSLFPSHMIEWLKNLELIILEDCDLSREVIFQLEELNVGESHVASVLDLLRELILCGLNNLMHIWKKGPERISGFGNVRYLYVGKCNSLTYLFSPSIAKLLVMLEKIEVVCCGKIEEILARAGEEEEEKDVLFHKVNSIMLWGLPNLKYFCNEANALEWPSLNEITVIGCPSLSTFIPSNLNTPKLEGVYNEEQRVALPSEKERTCYWKGELNATIKYIFKGKEKQANHEIEQGEQT